MNKQQSTLSDTEEELSTLVDEVMRGERMIWFPPGTLVSSLLIPCFSCAAVPLGFLLFANIFPLQNDTDEIKSILYPMGAGLIIVSVGFAMLTLAIQGRIQYGRRLLFYVRFLMGIATTSCLAIISGWLNAPLAMGACLLLLLH